jgi:hypothetical protein
VGITASWSTLQYSGNLGIDSGHIAGKVGGYGVALGQIGRALVAHPDFTCLILPDQRFQRQVECKQWRRHHKRRAGFGAAEDQYVGLLHAEYGSFRLIAMVYMGEDAQMVTLNSRADKSAGPTLGGAGEAAPRRDEGWLSRHRR